MPLDSSTERRILVQRQVRPRLIVIVGICGEDPLQMPCTEDENVIQQSRRSVPMTRSA